MFYKNKNKHFFFFFPLLKIAKHAVPSDFQDKALFLCSCPFVPGQGGTAPQGEELHLRTLCCSLGGGEMQGTLISYLADAKGSRCVR